MVVVPLAVALWAAGGTAVYADEPLEINGAFVGQGLPTGWGPNKPGYWDDSGKVALTYIPDLEKTAVRLTSATRAMSMYCTRRFAVAAGDKVMLKALLRGEGAGSLGVYFYPAGGWLKKEFPASADWSEIAAEFTLGEEVSHISVVIGIPPCASVEFLDVAATVTRKGQ